MKHGIEFSALRQLCDNSGTPVPQLSHSVREAIDELLREPSARSETPGRAMRVFKLYRDGRHVASFASKKAAVGRRAIRKLRDPGSDWRLEEGRLNSVTMAWKVVGDVA